MHCANPGTRVLIGEALVRLAMGALPVIAAPVLVRPVDRHAASDFGCFRDNPDEYEPATIRFCIARIEGSLEDLAAAVYNKARSAA